MSDEINITYCPVFKNTFDITKALTDEQFGKVVRALCEYMFGGEQPESDDPIVNIVVGLSIPSLDASRKKMIAGNKGGKAKQTESMNEANQKQTASKTEANGKQNESKTEANQKQTTSNKEKDKEKDKNKEKNKDREKKTIDIYAGTVSDFVPKSETSRGSSSDTAKINDLIKQFSQDDEKINQALHEFVRMRSRNHKPLTAYAMNLALKKLAELSPYRGEQLSIINQAVEKAWMSFYPLKDKPEQRKETEAERIERIMRDMGQLGENEHL